MFGAEAEESTIMDEISAMEHQKKSLEVEIVKYKEFIRSEKLRLAKKFDEAERAYAEFEAMHNEQVRQKDAVEKTYLRTLDEYDALHDMVKEIKHQESGLSNREDYEKLLQAESVEWAEEEHALRCELSRLQNQQKERKKFHQQEIGRRRTRTARAASAGRPLDLEWPHPC